MIKVTALQPDTYTTTYFFKKNSFSIEHEVSGPKKDYKTTKLPSDYIKISSCQINLLHHAKLNLIRLGETQKIDKISVKYYKKVCL